ncbi:MAG: hypothetical protein HRT61_22325, partial [Ekhidna sp.]|nr:hypothetical protein [Ekhidna sp.]
MLRSNIIGFFLLVGSIATYAQLGNEWIDSNKTYYKFKIADEGFYRITRDELASVGFPVETVGKNRVQLFREGEEIALNVNSEGASLEWLEFYGYGKDGTQDADLYDPGDQPHTFYSLFTDSASYFLTFNLGDTDGKRVTFSNDRNTTGLTPETYHLEDTIQLFTGNYAPGLKFGAESAFSLSKYENGEGWTGSFLSKNNVRDYNFTLNDYQTNSGGPTLETVLIGGNSLNHNAEVAVGENSSLLERLTNIQFSGWGKQSYEQNFTDISVGSNGNLLIRVTAVGFPDAA